MLDFVGLYKKNIIIKFNINFTKSIENVKRRLITFKTIRS